MRRGEIIVLVTKYRPLVSVVVAALSLAAFSLAGCAGHADNELDDDDLEIAETDSTSDALTSPDPTAGGDDDRGEKSACRDGDDHKRKHHLRHKFKVLDRLDGARDKQITIASLPEGLSDRLIAKLHSLDTDSDGDVTRDELKAALGARKHGGHGGKGK
jgi:hypothetical protein